LSDPMDRADRAGARLVVFTLRTPGGLLDSTRAIISHMIAAKTPVAIFVGPAGARAASAGFILTIAADVAAMAPGTHLGAAHPVPGNGEKMDVTLAAQAVNESRAFTEEEAITASPPLIDLLALDVADLLRNLDGRSITRFNGATVVLQTAGAPVVSIEMTLRQRLLSAVAHPNV